MKFKDKYEFTREEHHLLFNLFIMAFMDYELIEAEYEYCTKSSVLFKRLQECFPENEYHLSSMFCLSLGGNANGNFIATASEEL